MPTPTRRARIAAVAVGLQAGGAALVLGPVPDGATGGADELPWRANFLSVRQRSVFACRCELAGARLVVPDVRVHAGLSPVGDRVGANADRPAVRPVS